MHKTIKFTQVIQELKIFFLKFNEFLEKEKISKIKNEQEQEQS